MALLFTSQRLSWLGATTLLCSLTIFSPTASSERINEQEKLDKVAADFYQQALNVAPILPNDLSQAYLSCPVRISKDAAAYKSTKQVNYHNYGWESRISHQWDFFTSPADIGKILLIDFSQTSGNDKSLAYRYLANANSQDDLFEPWSSSKIMAYTAAVAKARMQGVGGNSLVGNIAMADLITSVNSYAPFGQADGDSNAIATYFLNVADRDFSSALFHDLWLKLSNNKIQFRGAYGIKPFTPSDNFWRELNAKKSATLIPYSLSSDDPAYLGYRCDNCGLTGNKAMTTLAQAEWLKRLAAHQRDKATQHPQLEDVDIEVLFYGSGHNDKKHEVGGMTQGISQMLTRALASAIFGKKITSAEQAKTILDNSTNGQWRVWQKIGWGASETRGAGETVLLAHVCLPNFQGGREFTISAQTSQQGVDEIQVGYAGLKMQALLDNSLLQLLSQ